MKKIVLIIGLFFIISASCVSSKNINGNRNIIEKAFMISDYTNIKVLIDANVVYEQKSSLPEIIVSVDENIVEHLHIFVKDKTLHIGLKKGSKVSPSSLIIHTNSRDLEKIELSGSGGFTSKKALQLDNLELKVAGDGDIDLYNLNIDKLKAEISSSGNIHLRGNAENTNFSIKGSGNINSLDLEQEKAKCKITGSGSAFIYVTKDLDVALSSTGGVSYKGSATLSSKISGAGDITRLD